MTKRAIKKRMIELGGLVGIDASNVKVEIKDSKRKYLGEAHFDDVNKPYHKVKKIMRIDKRVAKEFDPILIDDVILHELIHFKQLRDLGGKEFITRSWSAIFGPAFPWEINKLEQEAHHDATNYLRVLGHNYTTLQLYNMKRVALGYEEQWELPKIPEYSTLSNEIINIDEEWLKNLSS